MDSRYTVVKYVLDFVLSVIGIILLSPILIIIAIWIKCDSTGPVLFRQVRVGKDEKLFVIYKFRTMVMAAEQLGTQLTVKEDPRITRCGRVLRTYKMDELPQLFNILRGEMSFVGPRPEVPQYVSLYNARQKNVLSVRPGLTDEASIKYRNENELLDNTSNAEKLYTQKIMPDKLEINLVYVKTLSFKKDLKIIIKTLFAIVKKNQDSLRDRGWD